MAPEGNDVLWSYEPQPGYVGIVLRSAKQYLAHLVVEHNGDLLHEEPVILFFDAVFGPDTSETDRWEAIVENVMFLDMTGDPPLSKTFRRGGPRYQSVSRLSCGSLQMATNQVETLQICLSQASSPICSWSFGVRWFACCWRFATTNSLTLGLEEMRGREIVMSMFCVYRFPSLRSCDHFIRTM